MLMRTGFIYFLIILLANTFGSISGMGGGVIIKPALDFFQLHTIEEISFYSTTAVFITAMVSTAFHLKSGPTFKWSLALWLSFGSIVGGYLGNAAFEYLLGIMTAESVNLLQIVTMFILLLLSLIYGVKNKPSYHLKNVSWYVISGLILGFIGSLLGIGGGPMNLALLILLFSVPIKEAAAYSITVIFFSQLTKILAITTSGELANYDLSMLWFIVPAAVIGGVSGALISDHVSSGFVRNTYLVIVLLVLGINVYNGFEIFF
jgi:uncharacterized membrane protein YfcA